MDLVVRSLTSADLATVEPWFDDTQSVRWLGGREWPRTLLALAAASTERLALAALLQGELVAVADVEKYPDGQAAVALVVAPARRRQNLATALLVTLSDYPALCDTEEFIAGVEQGNEASFCLVNKMVPGATLTPPDHEGFSYVTWRRQLPFA